MDKLSREEVKELVEKISYGMLIYKEYVHWFRIRDQPNRIV